MPHQGHVLDVACVEPRVPVVSIAQKPFRQIRLRPVLTALATLTASALALTILVRPTQDVVANGETRSLNMVNMHTGESINIAYMRGGRYDSDALKKLNYFLRDWRRDEPTRMDPRLFDTVWLAYRAVGASQPVHVVCGYRAPETNAMLRRRSRGVAKFSQHTLGKAMDFYIPGVQLASLRAAGLRLQRGGVGFYPTSGSPFVHMDAGSVRMWPRMTRAQLAAVFPDGKTVHIPTDGKPMPGYAAAYAQLQRNGGSVGGFVGGGEDDAGAPASGGGFSIASLFSGGAVPDRRSDSPQAIILADAQKRAAAQAAAPTLRAAAEQPAEVAVADRAEPEKTVPAEKAPVVVARADIPIPERRPAELQPQMVWQTGPAAQVALASSPVPLPPMRPAQDAGPAEVAAIAPVARPSVVQPNAPVFAEAARGFDAILKHAAPAPASSALGYAAAESPLQPQPVPEERVALVATQFERLDFASVSAPVDSGHDPAQTGLTRPDLDTVGTLIPKPSRLVVMRFGVAAYHDLRAERFSGAAIKPLRTASFVAPPVLFSGALAAN
jgi:uncharacterized protein YcbK (DUF882 family)